MPDSLLAQTYPDAAVHQSARSCFFIEQRAGNFASDWKFLTFCDCVDRNNTHGSVCNLRQVTNDKQTDKIDLGASDPGKGSYIEPLPLFETTEI